MIFGGMLNINIIELLWNLVFWIPIYLLFFGIFFYYFYKKHYHHLIDIWDIKWDSIITSVVYICYLLFGGVVVILNLILGIDFEKVIHPQADYFQKIEEELIRTDLEYLALNKQITKDCDFIRPFSNPITPLPPVDLQEINLSKYF